MAFHYIQNLKNLKLNLTVGNSVRATEMGQSFCSFGQLLYVDRLPLLESVMLNFVEKNKLIRISNNATFF